MADEVKNGLLRIVAYIPILARREAERTIAERLRLDDLPVVYVDSQARKHVVADMPNGYLHSAAAKLEREDRQPEALAAMKEEIARREAAKPPP